MDHVVVIWTLLAVFGALRETLLFTQSKKVILFKGFFSSLLFLDTFYVFKSVWKTGKQPNPLKKVFFQGNLPFSCY